MSISPAECFPDELWLHVLDHLSTRDIKNARYACPGARAQGCRALFHTITVGPTIYHLNRLRSIVGQPHDGTKLAAYVKVVEFNLCPLWRNSWDGDPGREEEEETRGTVSDYRANLLTEEPSRHLVHFAVEEFSEAFRQLSNVQVVCVLSTSCPPYPDRRGISFRQYDPQPIFFQLLSLCRCLPSRVQTFKILSGRVMQMALSIFNGSRLDSRTFRPKLGISQPPLSHVSILQSEFEYGMGTFTGIRDLEIHLYDQRFKRYYADPPLNLFDLKHALAVMASTLRKFSLTISTPGEDSWRFTRYDCVSHRDKFGRFSFGDIFSGIEFKSLEDVYLRNVEFHPRHLGGFLQKYASILQKVHMA